MRHQNDTRANAGIAGRRSVLTRTVFYRDESRLHSHILKDVSQDTKLAGSCTHMNSRDAIYKGGK